MAPSVRLAIGAKERVGGAEGGLGLLVRHGDARCRKPDHNDRCDDPPSPHRHSLPALPGARVASRQMRATQNSGPSHQIHAVAMQNMPRVAVSELNSVGSADFRHPSPASPLAAE